MGVTGRLEAQGGRGRDTGSSGETLQRPFLRELRSLGELTLPSRRTQSRHPGCPSAGHLTFPDCFIQQRGEAVAHGLCVTAFPRRGTPFPSAAQLLQTEAAFRGSGSLLAGPSSPRRPPRPPLDVGHSRLHGQSLSLAPVRSSPGPEACAVPLRSAPLRRAEGHAHRTGRLPGHAPEGRRSHPTWPPLRRLHTWPSGLWGRENRPGEGRRPRGGRPPGTSGPRTNRPSRNAAALSCAGTQPPREVAPGAGAGQAPPLPASPATPRPPPQVSIREAAGPAGRAPEPQRRLQTAGPARPGAVRPDAPAA